MQYQRTSKELSEGIKKLDTTDPFFSFKRKALEMKDERVQTRNAYQKAMAEADLWLNQ